MSLTNLPVLWEPQQVAEADAVRLNLAVGDRLELKEDAHGSSHVVQLRVVKRVRGGWRLENLFDETDVRTFLDGFISAKRCDGLLVVLPRFGAGMSEDRRARAMVPMDARKPREELEINCRLAYCERVDNLLSGREGREEAKGGAEGGDDASSRSAAVNGSFYQFVMTLEEACELSRERTWRDGRATWASRLVAIRAGELSARARRPVTPNAGDRKAERSHALQQPTCNMIRSWYERWKDSDRPQLELAYDHASKGNRAPKLEGTIGGRDPYMVMKEYGDRYYVTDTSMKVRAIHRRMIDDHPEVATVIPYPSTLQRFFDRQYSHSYKFARAVRGREKAGRDHAVGPRSVRPLVPMEEIEIDHCLADLIVVDDVSGRPLGRPWITAAIDRCTRMIVGIHVSYELPSWASVSRCLAQAFWPKDLRPYRYEADPESPFAVRHDWPCEGIPASVWTDRGLEFKGESLKASAAALGFAHCMLPARQPQLKGTIERFFGRMHAQVYDHLEGKTFHNIVARGEYRSVKEARIGLSEFRRRLLKWIVDEYHVTFHSELEDYPLRAWRMASINMAFRPAPDFGYLQQVLGQYRYQTISKNGIRILNHRYFHECMRSEVAANGPGHKYHIRFDPFDLGHLWFLPSGASSYVQVPSDRPELTVGVSLYQSRIRQRAARRFGNRMTVEDERTVALEVDRIAAERMADGTATTTAAPVARYFLPNGRFFTPVAGWDGIPKTWKQILQDPLPVTENAEIEDVSVIPSSSEAPAIAHVPDRVEQEAQPEEDWREAVERRRRELEIEMEEV